MSEPLVQVKRLKKYFPVHQGILGRKTGDVKAVDGVDLAIRRGETFGLVGESGSGKSTIGRTLLRLTEKTEGEVKFAGIDLFSLPAKELRGLRPRMQMVFQDPYGSLNPRIRIGDAIGEALLDHGIASKAEARELVLETLALCGLASYHIDRYPHEFSGGQRQRIGIARAIIVNPEFIVTDEPVSALDVSIQAQIINLLQDLQERRQLTYLFISHDLSVVEHLCSTIGVLYLGSLVEVAPRDELFGSPLHPYTKALLSAVPIPDPAAKRERIVLKGDIPSPANPPAGCKFHTRCPEATAVCRERPPVFRDWGGGHYAACHLIGE
ncbi:Oligopeptide transport ATP-binding protein OppF [Paenibacillus konkukensis]|uniref:Oligopeptide transport ATP-binding protein OppF n=1 Tax=Paenibacillus konkukensis TaxID=2020716 RepID=A0ABY4RNQ3_9BACL|nr:oligopeptide/dipeptide ABC transporter ATP-binding protein [Paenibacillus konkukensis]UQZ83783.1 Oligopeptide transport ATP-binding protein OppF [Paenibacillus konkukensis]